MVGSDKNYKASRVIELFFVSDLSLDLVWYVGDNLVWLLVVYLVFSVG